MIEITVTSPVLTSEEAARWLRLDEEHGSIGAAVEALHRIVQRGELRPIGGCGRRHKFLLAELERYVAAATDSFKPKTFTMPASDQGSEGKRPRCRSAAGSGGNGHKDAHTDDQEHGRR